MTGRELVAASLRLIGVIAPGESIDATEANDGLSALNRMLGGWSTEGLLIHATTQEAAITLSAGDATYTLGASGDITTRPMSIEAAVIRAGSIDHEVKVMSITEYAKVSNKSVQSPYPHSLYDDGGYPQRTVTLYPTPSAANSLILFTKRPLTSISTLDTSVSLPDGYDEALIYNLATRLAPEYGKLVQDAVGVIAMESKDGLKRANRKPSFLQVDDALLGGAGGGWDFDSGGY